MLKEAGRNVTIATMTPGDCGSAEHDAEAISAIRREEARMSAAVMRADYVCLEFRRGGLAGVRTRFLPCCPASSWPILNSALTERL